MSENTVSKWVHDRKTKTNNFFQNSETLLAVKDLAAGTVGGFVLTLVGHPFDTIKTRQQLYRTSFVKTVKQIIGRERLKTFYNGMAFPFYSVPAVNAIIFCSFEFAKRQLNKVGYTDSMTQGVLGGIFTGFVITAITTPTELIKCRLQSQYDDSKRKMYKSSLQCVKRIVREDGVKGLFRGGYSTLLREVPGYAGQFLAWEALKDFFTSKYGEFNLLHKTIAGGMAGIACWMCSYPQDIIKTRLQCEYGRTSSLDGGFSRVAKDILIRQGVRGLWQGLAPCLFRAFYANALCFISYEEAKKFI